MTNLEWLLCVTILKLRRWLIYSVVYVLHSVGKKRLASSARPQLKCRDGLPLSITTILRNICTQHRMKWLEYDRFHSSSKCNQIFTNVHVVFKNSIKTHFAFKSVGKRQIVFNIDKTSSKLSLATWCIESRTNLIATMKTLRRILCFGNEAEQTVIFVWHWATAEHVKEHVLLLFKQIEPNKDGVPHSYAITIPKMKTKLFHLAICYVLCKTSFCMVMNIISCTYEILSNPSLRFCIRHHVNNFVKVV